MHLLCHLMSPCMFIFRHMCCLSLHLPAYLLYAAISDFLPSYLMPVPITAFMLMMYVAICASMCKPAGRFVHAHV